MEQLCYKILLHITLGLGAHVTMARHQKAAKLFDEDFLNICVHSAHFSCKMNVSSKKTIGGKSLKTSTYRLKV